MKKKYVARLILLALFLAMSGCIVGVVKLLQGPEVVIKDGWFIQRKYDFKFHVPAGWTIMESPDKKTAQYLLRRYGFRKTIDAGDYLPTIAIQYGKPEAQGKTGILYALNVDYNGVKSDSDYYRDLRIDDKDVKDHPKHGVQGILSYAYTGIYEDQRQVTEIRYIIKGDVLVTFMLADFEDRFNNRVLNDLVDSLEFQK